jgi:hypothetical protein
MEGLLIMNYITTYYKSIKAFMDKLPSHKTKDMEENATGWIIQTTLVIKNKNVSLVLSTLTDTKSIFLKIIKSVQLLEMYDKIFTNEETLTIYKSVYSFDEPISYVNIDGTTKQYFIL